MALFEHSAFNKNDCWKWTKSISHACEECSSNCWLGMKSTFENRVSHFSTVTFFNNRIFEAMKIKRIEFNNKSFNNGFSNSPNAVSYIKLKHLSRMTNEKKSFFSLFVSNAEYLFYRKWISICLKARNSIWIDH